MEKLGRDVCNNPCRSTLAAILLHFLSNVTAELATAGFACVISSSTRSLVSTHEPMLVANARNITSAGLFKFGLKL
jgi:hypothetical protein